MNRLDSGVGSEQHGIWRMLMGQFEGEPDRRKALMMGILGGMVGTVVMRYYTRHIVRGMFPGAFVPNVNATQIDPQERHALVPRQYEDGETLFETAGRVAYTLSTGNKPQDSETRQRLGTLVEAAYFIAAGAAYGGTRTSTRWRDFAGGFFMGIRMWVGEEIGAPLLGLRAGVTRFTLKQHLILLTRYWSFTLVMANVTRVLYRLIAK
ncbi:MAG: hypothetical protein KF716_34440 [Anaerolineae bacterium]|nr:hypothetical protein [Anaerolineae bacterium]